MMPDPADNNFDVFVSYASGDTATAEAIVAQLEESGIRCWFAPRDIAPGESYPAAITDAISASRAFVLVLSNESNESDLVTREVERAVAQRLHVVPFRIEDARLSKDLQYLLGGIQWLNATTQPLERNVRQLAADLREFLSLPPRPDAPAPRSAPISPLRIAAILAPLTLVAAFFLLQGWGESRAGGEENGSNGGDSTDTSTKAEEPEVREPKTKHTSLELIDVENADLPDGWQGSNVAVSREFGIPAIRPVNDGTGNAHRTIEPLTDFHVDVQSVLTLTGGGGFRVRLSDNGSRGILDIRALNHGGGWAFTIGDKTATQASAAHWIPLTVRIQRIGPKLRVLADGKELAALRDDDGYELTKIEFDLDNLHSGISRCDYGSIDPSETPPPDSLQLGLVAADASAVPTGWRADANVQVAATESKLSIGPIPNVAASRSYRLHSPATCFGGKDFAFSARMSGVGNLLVTMLGVGAQPDVPMLFTTGNSYGWAIYSPFVAPIQANLTTPSLQFGLALRGNKLRITANGSMLQEIGGMDSKVANSARIHESSRFRGVTVDFLYGAVRLEDLSATSN